MDLIKRLYANKTMQKKEHDEIFDDGRPELLFSDEKSLVEFSRFIQRGDRDNYRVVPDVISSFIDLFNILGIGINSNINLGNLKISPSKYNSLEDGYCSFNYSLPYFKDNEDNVITYYAKYELYNNYPGIELSSSYGSIYCFIDHGIHIQRYSVKINEDINLTREYSRDTVLFMLEGIGKNFIIKVKRPIYDDCSNDYELINEKKFFDYLRNLTFPCDVLEIYNKLCEISLGSDLGIYPEVTVCEVRNTLSGWKDTNLISIKNGEIDSIIRTSGDKKISFDGNGNWNYMMSDENVMFTISSGDKISCSIETKNDREMDDYTDSLFRYDISTARSEVVAAKKLIREKIGLGCKREN